MSRPAPVQAAAAARAHLQSLEDRAERVEVRHAGRRVIWRGFGEGPALVLLHGGHGSWAHWVHNIEALSHTHRLWLPDMPGYGESDDPPPAIGLPERLQALAGELAASLDGLLGPGTPVDLAGFSFGGLVATALATQRGQVRRLVLLGCAGHGGPRRMARELIDWRGDDPVATRAALEHNLATLMLHAPGAIDELALQVHERSCRAARFRSKAISRSSPLPGLLAPLQQPVLLIWGEHDVTAVPEQAGPLLVQGRAERHWQVVPQAGHWVQYEQPEATHRLMLPWLAQ